MTLWQHVLSWSHVFLLLTLNIYSHGKQRHLVSFYNSLVVIE